MLATVNALLITSPTNIRWLTGFAGSAGTVLVHDGEITLFTDSRYTDRAPGELADVASSADIVIARATLGAEVRELAGRAEVVGLEADHVTWAQQQLIEQDWLPKQTLVPTSALVDGLRSRKDDAEIARIQAGTIAALERHSTRRFNFNTFSYQTATQAYRPVDG